MNTIRAAVLAALVLGGVIAVPAAGANVAGGLFQEGEETDERSDEPTMGEEVSSFMQSSSADTDESVETEMFVTAYENADDERRQEIVTDRARTLEGKLDQLRSEREELRERGSELNDTAYSARMSRLAVRIGALERAIDETEPRAAEAGVDRETIDQLRTETSNLTGPEIAAIARELAGVDAPRGSSDDAPRGPSDDANSGDTNPGDDRSDRSSGGTGAADDSPGGGPPDDSPGSGSAADGE